MKTRFIEQIGTRAYLRVYWGDDNDRCIDGCHHDARKHLIDNNVPEDWKLGGNPEDHPVELWPTKCDRCGAPVPEHATRQVFRERLYNTESGQPEPGDLYWNDWLPEKFYWDNHKGPHLMAVLPNGVHWCIDSRANNCNRKDDRTHRCWVRHGEPPNIHVDKNGDTCQAGAGSILSGNYHGFLHDGEFTNA